jgi:hypothetical protein
MIHITICKRSSTSKIRRRQTYLILVLSIWQLELHLHLNPPSAVWLRCWLCDLPRHFCKQTKLVWCPHMNNNSGIMEHVKVSNSKTFNYIFKEFVIHIWSLIACQLTTNGKWNCCIRDVWWCSKDGTINTRYT